VKDGDLGGRRWRAIGSDGHARVLLSLAVALSCERCGLISNPDVDVGRSSHAGYLRIACYVGSLVVAFENTELCLFLYALGFFGDLLVRL
jgi:hypothetical protein